MQIYDHIGESYKKQSLASMKRRVSADYTFLKYIGDVRGKSVLDLACGDGCYCRPLKQAGASRVIGVDISRKMIDLARNEEARAPLGIAYQRHDVIKLPKMRKFYIIIASLLLHYSKTKDELSKMCRNIYANLKDGGRLVGLNSSPSNPIQKDRKYDSTRTCNGPVREGCIITISLYDNNRLVCSFNNYHWEKKTYERALKDAGFEEIKWHEIKVSNEGMERFGHEFWKGYLKHPGLVVFECRKPREKKS